MLPGSFCGDHTHNVQCSQYAVEVAQKVVAVRDDGCAAGGTGLVWLIVGIGLLVAFGPIVWLMPSRRDRQLAQLREAARRAGLVVELVRVPALDATPEERVSAGGVSRDARRPCTAYRLPVHGVGEDAPGWFLLREPGGTDPLPGWNLHPEVRPRLPREAQSYWTRVEGAVAASLLERCIALECTPAAVTWYWLENAGPHAPADIVADIARCLGALAALQEKGIGAQ